MKYIIDFNITQSFMGSGTSTVLMEAETIEQAKWRFNAIMFKLKTKYKDYLAEIKLMNINTYTESITSTYTEKTLENIYSKVTMGGK